MLFFKKKKDEYILLAKRKSDNEIIYKKEDNITLEAFEIWSRVNIFGMCSPAAWDWCYIMNLKNNEIIFDFLKNL